MDTDGVFKSAVELAKKRNLVNSVNEAELIKGILVIQDVAEKLYEENKGLKKEIKSLREKLEIRKNADGETNHTGLEEQDIIERVPYFPGIGIIIQKRLIHL